MKRTFERISMTAKARLLVAMRCGYSPGKHTAMMLASNGYGVGE
jgi:hypothetical protein